MDAQALSTKFSDALVWWEESSSTSEMIELLTPFTDESGLDLEASWQAGCDWSFIEIQGRVIAPGMDDESGSAIMFMVSWLMSKYSSVDISYKDNEWIVALWGGQNDWDGPIARSSSLATAVLDVVVQTWPPN